MYRGCKYFDNEKFSNEFENELSKVGSLTLNYEIFKNGWLYVVNIHAPLKKNYIRANNAENMDYEFKSSYNETLKARNVYLKRKREENRLAYKKQATFLLLY